MSEENTIIETGLAIEDAEHICQCGRPAANGYESCPVCADARMSEYHINAINYFINSILGVTL